MASAVCNSSPMVTFVMQIKISALPLDKMSLLAALSFHDKVANE